MVNIPTVKRITLPSVSWFPWPPQVLSSAQEIRKFEAVIVESVKEERQRGPTMERTGNACSTFTLNVPTRYIFLFALSALHAATRVEGIAYGMAAVLARPINC